MQLLNERPWAGVYRSGEQNLLEDFYAPALQAAVGYDRAVGYFSSELLVSNLQGIKHLIENNGEMRLIIGHPLDPDEFEAVKQGHRRSNILESLGEKLGDIINEMVKFGDNRLVLLSNLIAAKRLTVKYALRKKGMYHEKIGIIKDAEGNRIVFHGSANETVYALSEGFNAESISVYKSWSPEVYELYGKPYEDGFEMLWKGLQKNTVTIDVPSDFYEKVSNGALDVPSLGHSFEADRKVYEEWLSEFFDNQMKTNYPTVPEKINGSDFSIREHQKDAIRRWIANRYHGILKLSTGSGKTITAIYAATKIFDARLNKGLKTALVVSVPYQQLAKQWVENLAVFNIFPVECWKDKTLWLNSLKKQLLDFKMGATDFISVVVVNRTLESEKFGDLIGEISSSEIMFIGDECHNHGSEKTNQSLPDAYYRMGLSATPYRSDEDELDSPFPNEAKFRINQYYGGIAAEYSLGDAIHDGVLCEYDYYIVPVYLTEEEQEEYESLSNDIAKLVSYSEGASSSQYKNEFTALCGKRARLLGAAKNKLVELAKICKDIPREERRNSLFYCGEGSLELEGATGPNIRTKIIEQVSSILEQSGWHTTRFTSEENSNERLKIMDNFITGAIDALVSMKVLDEGVDVPICDKAFILASTRNPRQYIQRRGRVLRMHPDKEFAIIYDFVVLPISDSKASDRLRAAELERVDDFILLAKNRFEIEKKVDQLGMRG